MGETGEKWRGRGEEREGRKRGYKNGRREEKRMTLHTAFVCACWLQILLPYIKILRLVHVLPTAGHSHFTMASAYRQTLWLGTLC